MINQISYVSEGSMATDVMVVIDVKEWSFFILLPLGAGLSPGLLLLPPWPAPQPVLEFWLPELLLLVFLVGDMLPLFGGVNSGLNLEYV